MARKDRPNLRIVANYMIIEGETVLIDPVNTDLPDRCKVAVMEMFTGLPHELVVESDS